MWNFFSSQSKVKMENKWMSKFSIQYKFTKTIENNPFLGKEKNHKFFGITPKMRHNKGMFHYIFGGQT